MDPETEDEVGHSFSAASGTSYQDCLVIAQRFPERIGFTPADGESWAVLQTPAKTQTLFSKRGWYTGVWRSTTGAAFISDAGGQVHRLPGTQSDPSLASWTTDAVPATLTGIWGLDDQNVYTWGLGANAAPTAFRWDGSSWTEMPRLERGIVAMHGRRRDCILAVGRQGLVAWWDGSRWIEMGGVSTELTLGSVHYVSDDEIYAGSPGGALLRGSLHGWSTLYEGGQSVGSLAHWQDELWVGCLGDSGLSKLDGREVISVKPNLRALKLDARGELLLCTLDAVVSTPDGARFAGRIARDFGDIIARVPFAWR